MINIQTIFIDKPKGISFSDFLFIYDMHITIHERSEPGEWTTKYYATVTKHVDEIHGCIRASKLGNGDTRLSCVKDLCKELSNRDLMIENKFIHSPTLKFDFTLKNLK